MTLHPAAFRVGEFVKLASAARIRDLQEECAEHRYLFQYPNMDAHADKIVLVVQNSWPIPGVAYRVEEVLFEQKQRASILGIWPEEALIDHGILPGAADEPSRCVASEVYNATSDSESGPGMVSIRNMLGELFCCFRDDYAMIAANAINHIARLRCRSAFEQYFGFDGDYREFQREETDGEPSDETKSPSQD